MYTKCRSRTRRVTGHIAVRLDLRPSKHKSDALAGSSNSRSMAERIRKRKTHLYVMLSLPAL